MDKNEFFRSCFEILSNFDHIAYDKLTTKQADAIEYLLHGDIDFSHSEIDRYINSFQKIIDGELEINQIIPIMSTFLSTIKGMIPKNFNAEEFGGKPKIEKNEAEILEAALNDESIYEDDEEEAVVNEFEIEDFHEEDYGESLDNDYYDTEYELHDLNNAQSSILLEDVITNKEVAETEEKETEEVKFNDGINEEIIKPIISENSTNDKDLKSSTSTSLNDVSNVSNDVSEEIQPFGNNEEEKEEDNNGLNPIVGETPNISNQIPSNIIKFNLTSLMNTDKLGEVSFTTNNGLIGFNNHTFEVSYMAYNNGIGVETFKFKLENIMIECIVYISSEKINIESRVEKNINKDKRAYGYNYFENIGKIKGTVSLDAKKPLKKESEIDYGSNKKNSTENVKSISNTTEIINNDPIPKRAEYKDGNVTLPSDDELTFEMEDIPDLPPMKPELPYCDLSNDNDQRTSYIRENIKKPEFDDEYHKTKYSPGPKRKLSDENLLSSLNLEMIDVSELEEDNIDLTLKRRVIALEHRYRKLMELVEKLV